MATPSIREQIAYHEAGHFVVAREEQSPSAYLPGAISIKPSDDTLGHCGGAEGCQGNEEEVLVSYAGHAAMIRFIGRELTVEEAGAGRDYAEAEVVIEKLVPTDTERNKLRKRLKAKAKSLVDEHWEKIRIVALALLDWETITGDEADMLCELASGQYSVEEVVRFLCLAGRCIPDELGKIQPPKCIESWSNRTG